MPLCRGFIYIYNLQEKKFILKFNLRKKKYVDECESAQHILGWGLVRVFVIPKSKCLQGVKSFYIFHFILITYRCPHCTRCPQALGHHPYLSDPHLDPAKLRWGKPHHHLHRRMEGQVRHTLDGPDQRHPGADFQGDWT